MRLEDKGEMRLYILNTGVSMMREGGRVSRQKLNVMPVYQGEL